MGYTPWQNAMDAPSLQTLINTENCLLTLKTNNVNSNNKKIITCPQPLKDLMIICKISDQ